MWQSHIRQVIFLVSSRCYVSPARDTWEEKYRVRLRARENSKNHPRRRGWPGRREGAVEQIDAHGACRSLRSLEASWITPVTVTSTCKTADA